MNSVDAKTGKLRLAERLARAGLRRHGSLLLDPGGRLRPRLRRQQRLAASTASRLSSGELAWSYSTGGYAYSGPAVANTRHTGPTVYIGSFDGNVYALNAESGEPRWIELGRRLRDRLPGRDRQHRLRRRVRQHLDHRLRDEDRQEGVPLPPRHLHAGRSPTAAASTWSATRASPPSSPSNTPDLGATEAPR